MSLTKTIRAWNFISFVADFDIYQLMHVYINNVLVYNVNIKTLKNT